MQIIDLARRAAALASALVLSLTASAQVAPLQQDEIGFAVDSGFVNNDGAERGVIFSTTIMAEEASWLRLSFAQATLGAPPAGGEPTVIRLTSFLDGAVQHLDDDALWQWQDTSAYFNGDRLHLELIADPGAERSRVTITLGWAGTVSDTPIDSICGPTDDRELSSDPRAARALPIGCTAWIIDDPNHCQLTAGHCTGGSFDVIEFNVPLSTSGGQAVHPPPSDQYIPDPASIQSNGGQGTGNDWAYFGCLPNSETGLTPYEAQGAFFVIASPPTPAEQPIRITGFGTTSSPVPPQWNLAQKTHVGPFFGIEDSSWLQYVTDTTGGNSGSPVIDETTGEAIGIHTHGGCSGGFNSGTGINHSGLQLALLNPQGVCIPTPPLLFSFPAGLPESLDPSGDTIRVVVTGQEGGEPQTGTGMLHYQIAGEAEQSIPMVEVEPNVYDAVFPALPCAEVASFYFSAETTDGEIVLDPIFAPEGSYGAVVASEIVVAFEDDFEDDLGWTVVDSGGLTAGTWERGVPVGGGDRGDPPTDSDGSGQCYITQNQDDDADVDDGTTTLISPLLDATDPDSRISYSRWYSNTFGAAPASDVFDVDVSDDGGATWVALEQVGPDGPEVSGGWFFKEFVIAEIPGIQNTEMFQIRFLASDLGAGSVVEAGVDGVQVRTLICGGSIPGDTDGDGDVDFADLLQVMAAWGACPPPPAECVEDVDGDGMVGFADLLQVLVNWTG